MGSSRRRRRPLLGTMLALLAAALLAPKCAHAEAFLSVYGGYARNDDGIEDGAVYGLRGGFENPIAGAQLGLDVNRQDGVRMDTLIASALVNFVSRDRRRPSGRILFNSVSAHVTLGFGGTRFDDSIGDASLLWTWELGIGGQVKLTRSVGLRFDLTGRRITPRNLTNYQGTLGLGFYF